MPPSIYLETTIISYLASRPSRNPLTASHQALTHRWWRSQRDHSSLCISRAVIEEASIGDSGAASRRLKIVDGVRILPVTLPAVDLAERLVREVRRPQRAAVDALHVAVAATHGVEVLLTWNCRHLAGVSFRTRIESVCRAAGYSTPAICTPLEVMEPDDEG
jgi:predicted nucleic acid-binding protein